MSPAARLLGGVVAGMLAAPILLLLDRILLRLESKGWIYWRRSGRRGGTLGNALLEVHAIVEPRAGKFLEATREERADASENGDPVHPGRGPTAS